MANLPYKLYKLTPEMLDRAHTELGETDEVRSRSLAQLKKFIKDQGNISYLEDDDLFFTAFLRKSKYDMKKVFKLILSYFKETKNFSDVFGTANFPAMIKCFEEQITSVMPYRDKDGCAVIVIRSDKWDYNEFKFALAVHFIGVTLLATGQYDATQVCGIKVIFSTKGVSWSHLPHIQLRYLTLLARGVRYCLPLRVKGIHITHENVHVQFLWNLISFYVGHKLRSRIHFHGTDLKSLHDFIDPSVIPTDLGGQLQDDPSFMLKEITELKEVYMNRLLRFGYR